MRPIFYRLLLTGLCALTGAVTLSAQPFAAAADALPGCGTARLMRDFDRAAAIRNTAERTPELYRQALAEAEQTAPRLLSSQEESFWAPDYVTTTFISVKAVRVHMGRLARIWVDVRDTGRTDLKAKLQTLISALEDSTAAGSRKPGLGIIANDIEVFGPTPTTVGDGYQDFLLFDISEQSILGFFLPGDQTTAEFSNRRNMLYIDSREGMTRTSSVLNTLAHEFQHLIHFGINPASDLFLNEGCSEVAGLMCGYPDRANTSYLRNTNTNLLDFPRDPLQANEAYERALTVMHYLYEQFGDGFLRAIPAAKLQGMRGIDSAIATVAPAASWRTVAGNFAVANWLQTSTDPRYNYRVKLTSSMQRQARPLRTYPGSAYRPLDEVVLAPYGIAYIVYDNPGTLTLRLKGRYQYKTIAICYSGDNVEVLEFAPGELITLGSGFPYDRVVLTLVEIANASQKMTWGVNEGVSGVESDAVVAAGFRSIAPNPSAGRTEIAFAMPTASTVGLSLHAPDGELVRTIVDAERLPAGTHRRVVELEGLPAGAYIARLAVGERVETRLVVVR